MRQPPPSECRFALQRAAGRWRSAVAAALASLGASRPGTARLPGSTERMRRTMQLGAPVHATLSYLTAGAGAATRVVLLHGTPGSAETWADYLLAPPAGVELLAPDRPGFGRSGPAGAVTGLAAQAAAVAALLADDGRPTVLVGHSLGGAIVARVAAEHPRRVAALVLLAASLDPALEQIHPLQRIGRRWPLCGLLPRAIRNANAELIALRDELVVLGGLLDRVTAPVLIVHGTADDLVPVANVAYLQQRLVSTPCRRTLLLPGGNHFLPWNAEAGVRAAIGWAAAVRPC
ncbi:MAG: alpha/beta fold hydrolase [Rhizobacter sp.]|nr:alpha/beta fold hydrolase [Rhizobacter sp.]